MSETPPRPAPTYTPVTEIYAWTTVVRDPKKGFIETMLTLQAPGQAPTLLAGYTLAEAETHRPAAEMVAAQSNQQVWLRKYLQAATIDDKGRIVADAPLATAHPRRVVPAKQMPSSLTALGARAPR